MHNPKTLSLYAHFKKYFAMQHWPAWPPTPGPPASAPQMLTLQVCTCTSVRNPWESHLTIKLSHYCCEKTDLKGFVFQRLKKKITTDCHYLGLQQAPFFLPFFFPFLFSFFHFLFFLPSFFPHLPSNFFLHAFIHSLIIQCSTGNQHQGPKCGSQVLS